MLSPEHQSAQMSKITSDGLTRISRILLRHHWSSASTFLASTLDRAQHSDPHNIIGKMQTLYSFSLLLKESRDFQMNCQIFASHCEWGH